MDGPAAPPPPPPLPPPPLPPPVRDGEDMVVVREAVDLVATHRTGNDEAMLKVLVEISAKLSRLEDRLMLLPRVEAPRVRSEEVLTKHHGRGYLDVGNDDDGSDEGGLSMSCASDDIGSAKSAATSAWLDTKKDPTVVKDGYYEAHLETLNKSRPMLRDFPKYVEIFPRHKIPYLVPEIPASVSNSEWRYYSPVWREGDVVDTDSSYDSGLRYEHPEYQRGHGRHNFIGAWDLPIEVLPPPPMSGSSDDGFLQRVPYSVTVPIQVTKDYWRRRFSDREIHQLQNRFGGIWTVPPDLRLRLRFQHHVLRGLEPSTDIIEYATDMQKSIRKLIDIGGELSVRDIDTRGNSYAYKPFESTTSADVDEWALHIEPTLLLCQTSGFPDPTDYSSYHTRWSRFITISGLADTFEICPWNEILTLDGLEETHMFSFHTCCKLKAHELEIASFFHISWVEIQTYDSSFIPVHQAWRQTLLPESIDTAIATVGGSFLSVRRDQSADQLTKNSDFWTILSLCPKSSPTAERTNNRVSQACSDNFWNVIAYTACDFIIEASDAWIVIAETLEDMLSLGQDQQATIEDDKFTQSQKLFWVINKIDSFIPMLADAAVQWEWFKAGNKLGDMEEDIFFHRFSEKDPPSMRWVGDDDVLQAANAVPRRIDVHEMDVFKDTLRRGDKFSARLRKTEERFVAMRDRAKSLRDGLFALTSVKEARDARLLGENVKLLTYVTIFYLPLAFCTSMWAINDMFGTGIKGFIGITIGVACVTYAGVLLLMYPKEFGVVSARFKHSLSWRRVAIIAKPKSVKKSVSKSMGEGKQMEERKGNGKGKETEKDTTGIEEILVATEQVPPGTKKKISSLFHRGKGKTKSQGAGDV